MNEKEYKALLKQIKKDLKPAISAFVKKYVKKELKETLQTLNDFNFLNGSYSPQRPPTNEKILPPSYSNSKKLKTIRENVKVGNMNVPVDVPQSRPSDPSQVDYSNFLDNVEKAEDQKRKKKV